MTTNIGKIPWIIIDTIVFSMLFHIWMGDVYVK